MSGQEYFDPDFVSRFRSDGRSKTKICSMGSDGGEYGHAYLPAPVNGKYPAGCLLAEPAMPGNYGPPSVASRAAQASSNKAASSTSTKTTNATGHGKGEAGSSGNKRSR